MPPSPTWCNQTNNIRWKERITKLIIISFVHPFVTYVLLGMPVIPPAHSVQKLLSSCLLFTLQLVYFYQDLFLSNTDPTECNFATILWIIALHDTLLSGCLLWKCLQHFLHKGCCEKIVYVNNLWSALYFIFWHYFTALWTVFVCIPRTTIRAEQTAYWDEPIYIW